MISVTNSINEFSKASGQIFEADKNCASSHFHGDILGKKDPHPNMCGWGKLTSFNDASLNIRNISRAINFNFEAELGLDQKEFPTADLTTVSSLTENSLVALDNTNSSVRNSKLGKTKTDIIKNIKCAKARTKIAKGVIDNLKTGRVHKGDTKFARKLLNKALRCSKRAFKTILNTEKTSTGKAY